MPLMEFYKPKPAFAILNANVSKCANEVSTMFYGLGGTKTDANEIAFCFGYVILVKSQPRLHLISNQKCQ